MIPRQFKSYFLVLIVWCLVSTLTVGQISFFEMLPADSVIKVEIITDLKKLTKGKNKPSYQPAEFIFHSGPLDGTSYNIQVKARGNARRKLCQYPPIKLKFPKSKLNFHKIKWVSICRNNKGMEEKLLNEYLIYKLYSMLTEFSYTVRLLEVDFRAPEAREPSLTAIGFIVEPTKELAQRTETKEYEPRIIKASLLDRHLYPLFSVFQYLIGNTDWHLDNMHNIKLLRNSKTQSIVPVPYDFDYSGFVDAPYAVPHNTLPIKNVRERYNKAHCVSKAERKEICELVCSKKEEMYAYIDNFTLLSKRSRGKLRKYLEDGFDVLESEKRSARVFVKDCEACPQ
jgi:hypothetical protein